MQIPRISNLVLLEISKAKLNLVLLEISHALCYCTFSMESSEGIQVEYIAIFIAVLFPGALVAFNDDLLQASEHLTALRIYSAGIWHNAVVS